LLAVVLLASGCGDDDTASRVSEAPSTTSPTASSTAPSTAAPLDTQPTDSATATSTTTAAPATVQGVEVTIDCARGELLSELDIDLSKVTFVPDDASNETTWIIVDVTVDNPTAEWVQVDPSFDVAFLDADGAEIVTQPWIDPTYDSVYADIVATSEFLVQPGQSSMSRAVVFAGFSGPLTLRAAQPQLLESLHSCQLDGEPSVEAAVSYAPPPGVTLELTGCAPNADRTRVVGELTASNDTDQNVALDVTAEVVDSEGNRMSTIGTFETPLTVAASTTVTAELIGNAAYLNADSIAACNLYAATADAR
jgi:hypothetical protein